MAGAISLRPAIVRLLVEQPRILLHEGRCYGRITVSDMIRHPVISDTYRLRREISFLTDVGASIEQARRIASCIGNISGLPI
jgi:hypothetical protein